MDPALDVIVVVFVASARVDGRMLSFEDRELKFCIKTPHINAKKIPFGG